MTPLALAGVEACFAFPETRCQSGAIYKLGQICLEVLENAPKDELLRRLYRLGVSEGGS